MPSEPADQVIGGLDHAVALVGLVDLPGFEEPQQHPRSSGEGQVVRLLQRQVRPALADPEGEGGLELLGAVGPGIELPGVLGERAGLRHLRLPAGDRREGAEGQHHPHQKGVLRSRTVHLARPLPSPPCSRNYSIKTFLCEQYGYGFPGTPSRRSSRNNPSKHSGE